MCSTLQHPITRSLLMSTAITRLENQITTVTSLYCVTKQGNINHNFNNNNINTKPKLNSKLINECWKNWLIIIKPSVCPNKRNPIMSLLQLPSGTVVYAYYSHNSINKHITGVNIPLLTVCVMLLTLTVTLKNANVTKNTFNVSFLLINWCDSLQNWNKTQN